jgi:predicted CopG family antitoxin
MGMSIGAPIVTRRTISLPDDLARKIERAAKKEKRSFSGMIAHLVEEALSRRKTPIFRSLGIAEGGPPDLSLRVEEYLRESLKEFKD